MSNDTPPKWIQRINVLLEPAHIMSLAIYHFVAVVLVTLFKRWRLSALLHPSKIREEAFSNFWLAFSAPPANPPKELTGSAALVPGLLAKVRGTVLEIGPGSGSQIQYYGAARAHIKAIYAAEPAEGLHPKLRSEAAAAGLEDKYHILTCSAATQSIIPALAKTGLLQKGLNEEGVFDTIVCIRVLCSVPNAKDTMENLYRLLRPGGKIVVVEHVVNPWWSKRGSKLARLFQAIYMLMGWRFWVGDCEMDRDTGGILKQVGQEDGGWAAVNLKLSFWWAALPYISGELVKRSHSWS